MIGSYPARNTMVGRLSSKIMPLKALCQDIPDFPSLKFKVAHFYMIGVAQTFVIKYSPSLIMNKPTIPVLLQIEIVESLR